MPGPTNLHLLLSEWLYGVRDGDSVEPEAGSGLPRSDLFPMAHRLAAS